MSNVTNLISLPASAFRSLRRAERLHIEQQSMLGELRGSFPALQELGDLPTDRREPRARNARGAFPANVTAALEIRYNLGLHYAVCSFRGLRVVATTLRLESHSSLSLPCHRFVHVADDHRDRRASAPRGKPKALHSNNFVHRPEDDPRESHPQRHRGRRFLPRFN